MRKPERRFPVARVTFVAAAAVAVVLLSRTGHHTPRFRTLRTGVEFATLRGDPYCRMGTSDIAVLRLDPARVRLRVEHYTQLGVQSPLDILEWEHRTGALAVFNAGQYYPDWSYMGLLVSNGRAISRKPHPGFKAALVADPRDGAGPGAHVLDLDIEPLPADGAPWREVAQSFMLFDDDGKVRVRQSGQVAYRTAVGEDADGRILVIATEGGYTLFELAGLLRTSPLGLRRAMSMDGGNEAALTVRSGSFLYASFGHRTAHGVPNPVRSTAPLPAVIAVLAP